MEQSAKNAHKRTPMYRERRWQPTWLLALFVLMADSLAIAYGSAVSATLGWALAVVLTIAVTIWWWRGRADVSVQANGLKVGNAFLEREFIADVSALDGSEMQYRIRHSRADDWLNLLSARHGGVVIELSDETDPHRAWVIGSSQPKKLAQALTALVDS